MALIDDLNAEVKRIFATRWDERNGRVVPDQEDVSLDNEAVKFDRATVLYADLAASTILVDTKKWTFAAEVYRTYLYCAAKVIRTEGGVITAYDGDRVMAVFIGDAQSTPAARCALKINYAVDKVINPALKAQYTCWGGVWCAVLESGHHSISKLPMSNPNRRLFDCPSESKNISSTSESYL
jgi:class 3 adenylate cyclase